MIKKITEEHLKIRAIGEENNDKIRAIWREEARKKRNKKIMKWGLVVVLIIILLVIGWVLVF